MSAAQPLAATMFDGRSAAGVAVHLQVEADQLVATPIDVAAPPQRWPLSTVRWPERTRHGRRVLHLSDGASLQAADAAAFDAWAAALGRRETWLVRAQQNWRTTAAAAAALVALLVAGYLWGVPLAARAILAVLPERFDRIVGEQALRSFDGNFLKPSGLPAERQEAVRAAFAQAVKRAYPDGAPQHRIEFRRMSGPNAFALPGGTIILTDALVDLLRDREDALLGVLAHELGHVRERHGMRLVVQATLVGAVVGLVIGDFSTVLAGAPALLAQMSYARDIEREADADAAELLRRTGYAPAAMVVFFERVKDVADRGTLPLALASHPDLEDRMRYFREVRQR